MNTLAYNDYFPPAPKEMLLGDLNCLGTLNSEVIPKEQMFHDYDFYVIGQPFKGLKVGDWLIYMGDRWYRQPYRTSDQTYKGLYSIPLESLAEALGIEGENVRVVAANYNAGYNLLEVVIHSDGQRVTVEGEDHYLSIPKPGREVKRLC